MDTVDIGEGITHPNTDPLKNLEAFAISEKARVEAGVSFLSEALPLVESIDDVNDLLKSAGRDDLLITSPAQMMKIENVNEVLERCNNFIPNFQIFTGYLPKEEGDYFEKPTAITSAQLAEVAAGTPSFDLPHTHVRKAAFVRMLILFPDFATSLVSTFSGERGYGDVYQRREMELFIAYQLMSRLVDQSDKYVVRSSGEVDDWYLCR